MMAKNSKINSYTYDRGDHRKKHCWNQDRADFVRKGGALVGVCPNTITNEVAESILKTALPEPEPFLMPGATSPTHPKRFYNVYKGVVYEAATTNPGKSYHGYPWRAREGRPLPRSFIQQLRERATEEGCLGEFEDWLDRFG